MNAVSFWWLLIVVIKISYLVDANWITGNLCWSMPCMNGGSCFGSAYTYLCICPIHYNGVLCEKRLGVCQENPCGNRGLCIDKSLTSFECRCYFDYMGPTCEEHVTKNDPNMWSSLLPVHTRVLFDMLQEAYHAKSKTKSLINLENAQIDFIDLLSTPMTSTTMTSTTVPTTFITDQSETIKTEHIIQAHDIQLDKIFPDISPASTLDTNIYGFREQYSQLDNSASPETDITTSAIEHIQPAFFNTTDDENMTEQSNIMVTSTPVQWLNNDNTIDTTTIQNLIEETSNSAELLITTTIKPTDLTSSIVTTTTDDITSSTDTTTVPQIVHSHLLSKLCKQTLPDTSSTNSSSNVLFSWFNKHLNRSPTSTVPSLIINKIQTASIPLQRIDIDDVLYQMSNNVDNEH